MTEFLAFTIYAPLASWGDIAVGEYRGSWDRPGRSAILGLLAAALGLRREDQEAHDALDRGVGVAVRLDLPGRILSEYQTIQWATGPKVRRHRPATRRELLELDEVKTSLSRRMFREDALYTVMIWLRADGRWSLGSLGEALRQPGFVLYAGRKSSALGLPLAPELIEAGSLAEAFSLRRDPSVGLGALQSGLPEPGEREIAHDPCERFPSGLRPLRRVVRRDAHPHRGRWQFADREMEIGVPIGALP